MYAHRERYLFQLHALHTRQCLRQIEAVRGTKAPTMGRGCRRYFHGRIVGIRPGEKLHEILVSEEEAHRTIEDDGHYVILPMLPELRTGRNGLATLMKEYSSAENVMSLDETIQLLKSRHVMVDGSKFSTTEILA